MPQGKILRFVLVSPALVHWSFDRWKNSHDINTTDTGIGVYIVDLPTTDLPVGSRVVFTFYWTKVEKWEGKDYEVIIEPKETGTADSLGIEYSLAHLGERNSL